MKRFVSAMFLLYLAGLQTISAAERRPGPDGNRMLCAIEADPTVGAVLDRMWEHSPTFRRQCRRLTSEGVRVRIIQEQRPHGNFNARSVLDRRKGILISADVLLRAPLGDYWQEALDPAELIGHELEHLLEQLDGVEFTKHAGGRTVWKGGREEWFETARAACVGRRVAQEMTAGGRAVPADESARKGDPGVITVRQSDRWVGPLSARTARVSASGRHVVFTSSARLLEEDRNHVTDVYVLDRATREVTLESIGAGGVSADGESSGGDITSDGRYVAFESMAGNIVETPVTAGRSHIYLRDRLRGATVLLTTNATGGEANGPSSQPVISADGRAVVFESYATDLLRARAALRSSAGIYIIDLASGTRARVDVSTDGRAVDGSSTAPAISADGRLVVFAAKADLMCAGDELCAGSRDGNDVFDIYLRDLATSTTTRISRSLIGGDPDGASYDPAISGDGGIVAFVSDASNLVQGVRSGPGQLYVYDRRTGLIELVTRRQQTHGAARGVSARPALSFDGSTIAFQSLASDLTCRHDRGRHASQDINLVWDVFVHDRATHCTVRASSDVRNEWMEASRAPFLDGTGRVLVFSSRHPIGVDDDDYDEDLYIVGR